MGMAALLDNKLDRLNIFFCFLSPRRLYKKFCRNCLTGF